MPSKLITMISNEVTGESDVKFKHCGFLISVKLLMPFFLVAKNKLLRV